jgi:hypothetical protein
MEDEADAAEHGQPQSDGDAAEQDDLGYIAGTQAPARIEAIADRAAGQGREADIVADGKADEGGERRLPPRQRPAGIAQAEPVEEGEAQIGGGREAGRKAKARSGNRAGRGHDLVQRVAAERAVEQHGGDAQRGNDEETQEKPGNGHGLPFARGNRR